MLNGKINDHYRVTSIQKLENCGRIMSTSVQPSSTRETLCSVAAMLSLYLTLFSLRKVHYLSAFGPSLEHMHDLLIRVPKPVMFTY